MAFVLFFDLTDLQSNCLSQSLWDFFLQRYPSIQLNISLHRLFVFQASLVYFPEQIWSSAKFNSVSLLFIATSIITFIDTLITLNHLTYLQKRNLDGIKYYLQQACLQYIKGITHQRKNLHSFPMFLRCTDKKRQKIEDFCHNGIFLRYCFSVTQTACELAHFRMSVALSVQEK